MISIIRKTQNWKYLKVVTSGDWKLAMIVSFFFYIVQIYLKMYTGIISIIKTGCLIKTLQRILIGLGLIAAKLNYTQYSWESSKISEDEWFSMLHIVLQLQVLWFYPLEVSLTCKSILDTIPSFMFSFALPLPNYPPSNPESKVWGKVSTIVKDRKLIHFLFQFKCLTQYINRSQLQIIRCSEEGIFHL